MSSSSPSSSQEALQAINNKAMGTDPNAFPVVTLPGGERVPTGTVGALLVNVKAYDATDGAGDAETRDALAAAIRAAVPVLRRVGMFDLFTPEEWASERSKGRSLVGEIAREDV